MAASVTYAVLHDTKVGVADTRMGPGGGVSWTISPIPFNDIHIQIDENLARARLRHIQLDHFGGNRAGLVIDTSLLLFGDFGSGHRD